MNKNYILNFGPQHPAAHGVLRLLLELDGERIVSADPHIGFLHRGTEKLIESKTYKQALPYFDRLDYVSMMSQEHGFVMAVESLLNIKPTLKALYIRVMFDEITRLLNHIMCITAHAMDVGALTPFLWGLEEREKLIAFYEQVSGSRMHAAYYCFGGVSSDVSVDTLEQIYSFANKYVDYINIINDLLSSNPIWISRLSGVGYVSKEEAVNMAFSGPVLRGSGVPWDLRVLQPYACYNKFKIAVPIGLTCDSYARYYVRLLEMTESVNIILQAVEWLINNVSKAHNSLNKENKVKTLWSSGLVTRNTFKSSMEELIFSFQENAKGIKVNTGFLSCYIEAPKGETGVFVISDGTVKPYKCKIKAPGFNHLQGLENMSKNFLIADIVTNIGSLDIVFGEIDR